MLENKITKITIIIKAVAFLLAKLYSTAFLVSDEGKTGIYHLETLSPLKIFSLKGEYNEKIYQIECFCRYESLKLPPYFYFQTSIFHEICAAETAL